MAASPDLGLIDLTKVASPDIRVKLRHADDTDAVYRLPGNAPSGLMIELMVLLREIDAADNDDLELVADLRGQLQEKVDDLFAIRNKDYAEGDVRLDDEELAALISGLFQRYYNAEESGARPTEPETEPEEEPSTPPRPRSARRSPQSSRARKAPSRSSTSSPT